MSYRWDEEKAKASNQDRTIEHDNGFVICDKHGKQLNVGTGFVGECEACLLEQKTKNQTDPEYLKFLEDEAEQKTKNQTDPEYLKFLEDETEVQEDE